MRGAHHLRCACMAPVLSGQRCLHATWYGSMRAACHTDPRTNTCAIGSLRVGPWCTGQGIPCLLAHWSRVQWGMGTFLKGARVCACVCACRGASRAPRLPDPLQAFAWRAAPCIYSCAAPGCPLLLRLSACQGTPKPSRSGGKMGAHHGCPPCSRTGLVAIAVRRGTPQPLGTRPQPPATMRNGGVERL